MSKKEPLVPLEAKGDSETVSVVDVLRKCGALVDENGNLIGSERSIVVSFLKFCNGPGIFVYFDGIQGLQDYCILNPQWILDQATYVVRDFKLHRFPRDYAAMELNCGESWTSLLKRGILDLPLLQKLWRGEDQSRVDFLLNFMIKIGIFGVLPRKTAGVEDEGSRLIVPGVITSSNFHLQGRQVSTLLSKFDQHVSIDNASNGERYITESFTFKNFLPTGFYDRLVTTFVSAWVQDKPEYQDPELFPDGCLLYCMESEDETRVNEPFAIHLKINSIDIITSSDGFMASILPQVATAMDKINKEIYNSGLKYHSPEVPPEVSPKKDTRSVYRNATQIEKEIFDIAAEDVKEASKVFSDFFREHGCGSNDADNLATTIINNRRDMHPIKLKKMFERKKQDIMKFQVDILENLLGIEDAFDQEAIIGALERCPELPPPEKYLIGYFREDEDLDCVTKEKQAIMKKLDGTMAQLSSNLDSKDAASLYQQISGKNGFKILHLAMHGTKGKDGVPTLAFKSGGSQESAVDLAQQLAGGCESSNQGGGSIKCIFINSCFSNAVANILRNQHGVPWVISWETKVNDVAAMTFAEDFYHFLGRNRENSENFKEAFDTARKCLQYRNWMLIDPDNNDSCSELGRDEIAAGIPRLHKAPPISGDANGALDISAPIPSVDKEAPMGHNGIIFISARFDRGPKEQEARALKDELVKIGVNARMVEAVAGDDFGDKTHAYLYSMKTMIAFCFEDYGQKTISKYSTYHELKYAYDEDKHIFPLRRCAEWPPRPPLDHDGGNNGSIQNAIVFKRGFSYLDWSNKNWNPAECAKEVKRALCSHIPNKEGTQDSMKANLDLLPTNEKNEGPVKLAASAAEKNEGSEKKQEGALMGIDGVTLSLLVLAAAIFALGAAKRK